MSLILSILLVLLSLKFNILSISNSLILSSLLCLLLVYNSLFCCQIFRLSLVNGSLFGLLCFSLSLFLSLFRCFISFLSLQLSLNLSIFFCQLSLPLSFYFSCLCSFSFQNLSLLLGCLLPLVLYEVLQLLPVILEAIKTSFQFCVRILFDLVLWFGHPLGHWKLPRIYIVIRILRPEPHRVLTALRTH